MQVVASDTRFAGNSIDYQPHLHLFLGKTRQQRRDHAHAVLAAFRTDEVCAFLFGLDHVAQIEIIANARGHASVEEDIDPFVVLGREFTYGQVRRASSSLAIDSAQPAVWPT